MKYDAEDEANMIRYLLGELSEEDRARIEERFLRDHEYLERLEAVEVDLNDSYVRGEMDEDERLQFEKRVAASPEWRSRVEFSRALGAIETARPAPVVVSSETSPAIWWKSLTAFLKGRNPAFNFALVTVAILMLVAGVWLVLETGRLRSELQQLRLEQQQAEQREQQQQHQTAAARERADELAEELARERSQLEELQRELEKQSTERTAVSFILTPGLSRGEEGSTKLTVPRDASLVRLKLYLQGPTPYKSYRAELRTASGKLVLSRDNLTARQTPKGKAVALNLSANAFTADKYELALKGVTPEGQVEDVGFYYFNLLKK